MAPHDIETILEKVRGVTEEIISPIAASVDSEARWPEEGMDALREARLTGLVNPGSSAGLGQGLFALVRVCETIGDACASTAICFGMHCVGSAVIAAKATSDQRERFLIPISEGGHLTTLALSEPGTGIHFYLPQCKLDRISSDTYRVTGTKTFVTNGGHTDSYVVSTMAADPNVPVDQFSCVMIPNEAHGLRWGPPWNGLGMRGNCSRTLELSGVEIPSCNLLGEEGDQIWYVFQVVAPYFLMAMAGTYLGLAGAALEEARHHFSRRNYSHSGSSLARISVLQHRLGCLWSEVERTRRFVYYAASAYDAGNNDVLPFVLSAKAEVADCAVNVVNEVMTLTGGIAYRDGSKLHRLLRDARASHVMAPTTDILRVWTGRALLEQPLLED